MAASTERAGEEWQARRLRLERHLQEIARPRHARWDRLGWLACRHYLLDQLGALGPVERHRFVEGENLILRLPGRRPQAAPVLVGAHYDGPPGSCGADDNASGVASLLELARSWSRQPPRRPVWIVAFDQEENGLLGSRALAAELRRRRQPLQLMLSLEMLGYTGAEQRYPLAAMRHLYGERGDFIAVVANLACLPLLPAMARRIGRHLPVRLLPVPFAGKSLPDVRRSDHSPFWDHGYRAAMVTDTAFLRNPHYHRSSDTLDTLNLPFLHACTDALEQALGQL
ncbi:MAG: M20/M25/M40 family metallo-hydrolase [Cyanobacteriota bacterium]|jgi:Zn-dependent M28 family amino/carboxypeptidase